jgi:hypothetical protein
MDIVTLAVFLAVGAVIFSLTSGIVAMAHDGQIGHQSSAQWMGWRILFQAVALILLLVPHSLWH